MVEPISTTPPGAAAVGLMALLVSAFGQLAADVTMVILAAFAGCVVALSGATTKTTWSAVRFILKGLLVSLTLAWAGAWAAEQAAVKLFGMDIASAYTPSLFAFILGFTGDRLPGLLNGLLTFWVKKTPIVEETSK